MIKLFKNIRKNLLPEGKTTNYLKYAIGEIILVVIGILIALSINNWNQNRQNQAYLKSVYKQVHTELVSDTLKATQEIVEFKQKGERIQNLLDGKINSIAFDTLNETNYKDCKICRSEVTAFRVNSLNTKGYQLLKTLNTKIGIKNDSLPQIIDEVYSFFIDRFKADNSVVSNLTAENIKDFERFPWYVDWVERRYNKPFLSYLFESEDYKKKLATYKIYVIKNQLRNVEYFMESARQLLPLLTKQIESK